jgi:hypothetical protein
VSVEDDEHSGQPSTSKTTKNFGTCPWRPSMNSSWARRHYLDQLWSLLGDHNRKFEHVPHCLEVCSPTLDKPKAAACECEKANEDPSFISRIITHDKSWVYGYDSETKQWS